MITDVGQRAVARASAGAACLATLRSDPAVPAHLAIRAKEFVDEALESTLSAQIAAAWRGPRGAP